jgi:HD-like signal output (HDOD) protein
MRMGNRLLQSSVVAYALRQVSRHETLTPHAREELNAIYTESIELAALSRVIAQKFTRLNADEATLTGLLSSIGRLYIFVKFSEVAEASDSAGVKEVIDSWHPAIAKAIGETWQLPDELLHALESQMSTDPELQEKPTLTEVLCAARLFSAHVADGLTIPSRTYPLLRRLGIEHDESPAATLEPFQEELNSFRSGLAG